MLSREERHLKLSEIAFENAGHSCNVHFVAHIEQRVTTCTQQLSKHSDTRIM